MPTNSAQTPDGRFVGRAFQGYLALAREPDRGCHYDLARGRAPSTYTGASPLFPGVAYLAQRNTLSAKTAFTEALRLAPNFCRSVCGFRRASLCNPKRSTRPRGWTTNSLQLEPGNARAHLIVGHAYLGQKDVPKAIAAFKARSGESPSGRARLLRIGTSVSPPGQGPGSPWRV